VVARRLLEYQQGWLRELIEHAVSSSPYYREALGHDALADDVCLDQLPVLTKQTLMEQFDRVAADPRLRLAAVEAHAASGDPGSRLGDEFHVFSTSGTTGRRGLFPQTASEFERWMAAAWRARGRIGLDAGGRVVGIGAPTPLHITSRPGAIRVGVRTSGSNAWTAATMTC
jgi:phenylacetate-coenzyme A ligase PaaK-like adenylate-forming protein